MRIVFKLLFFLATLHVSAQNIGNLLYANDILPVRGFFILDNGYKIITSVQNNQLKIGTYLLNKENLVVDTLKLDLLPLKFHNLGNSRVIMEGDGQYYVYDIVQDKMVPNTSIEKSDELYAGDFTIFFNKKLVTWVKNKEKARLIVRSMDSTGVFSLISKKRIIDLPGAAVKLNKNIIQQLPVVFALKKESLFIFSRGLQSLFIIDQDWNMISYKLPYSKEWIWSYFWDPIGEHHYVIKSVKDKDELYGLDGNKLQFICELEQFPIAIYDYKLLQCYGTYKTNCDFYLVPIIKSSIEKINLLEPVIIRNK